MSDVLVTKDFFIRPLRVSDAEVDYKIVTENKKILRKAPMHEMWKDWPSDDLSMEKELRDLKWHEEKHKKGEVLSYAVLTPKKEYIGNVYIFIKKDVAEVYYWIIRQELDKKLYNTIKKWKKELKLTFPKRKKKPI